MTLGVSQVVSAQGSFEPNVDRPGGDLHNFDIQGGPEACRSACLSDRSCVAWTFVRRNVQGASPRCWLKSSVPPPNGNSCCVSGIVHSGSARESTRTAEDDNNCCPNNMLVCPAGRHFCTSPKADAAAARRQPYNPAWQAAPGDTSCCPNSMLVCPTPRHFCAR
jgi:PAN domain